eukprot:scpid36802/ scgid1168/ 
MPSFNMKLKIFLKLAQARTSTAFTVRVSETDGESQPISGAGQMRTDQCEGIICLRKPCSLLSFRLDHRYTRTACHYNNLLLTCAEQDSLNAHLPLPPTGWVRHAPFASTLVSGTSCRNQNRFRNQTIHVMVWYGICLANRQRCLRTFIDHLHCCRKETFGMVHFNA